MAKRSWSPIGFVRLLDTFAYLMNKLQIKPNFARRSVAASYQRPQDYLPWKNHDAWWDLEQLKHQLIDAVDIFEYLHPDAVGVWVFDCSSSHKGLASECTLNVNNMNGEPWRQADIASGHHNTS